MILLNGHSLTVKDRFRPEAMGLNLNERQSTATLTVGPDAPEIKVDDWLKDDSEPGMGIVWRVKTVDTQYNTETRTISLEHAINTLRDRILFGDITPQTMGGTSSAVSARNAAAYILRQQNDWVLGDFAYDVSNPYQFNGDDLFSAMETVSSSLSDCIWEYDFSVYPFRLHVRRLSSEIGSEMRMSRNITTLKKTIDRSRMYTRFYPIGKNNKKLSGNGYVSRNEALYGTVSKTEVDQTLTTDAQLTAWANERLSRHAEPAVTVTVSGLELSEATGEPLDHFVIGRKCRIPLPEFSTAITERVTVLNWRDKLSDPESVTVTLANELQDVAKILRQQSASGGRSARAGAKEAEEDHAWFVDTTTKVEMVAEGIAGVDADGKPNWSRVSQLTVDGNGIDARVTVAEGGLVNHEARITTNERNITAEVSERISAITEVSGRVDVNSQYVGMVVEKRAGKLVIKSAQIVAAINDDGSSSAVINADHVYISGNTKLSGALTIEDGALRITRAATFGSGTGNLVQINNGKVSAPSFQLNSGGNITFVGTGTGEYYNLNVTALQGMVKSFSVDGNVLTLTPWYGDPVNFSKATALTAAWENVSGTQKYRVSATQNGVDVGHIDYDPPMRLYGTAAASNFSAEVTETQGSTVIARKSVYGYLIHHSAGSSSYVDVNTASDGSGTTVARINIGTDYSTWWNAGYDDAKGKVQMPSAAGSGEVTSFDLKVPNAARTGQDTKTFSLSQGTPAASGYASVSYLDEYSRSVVVGRIDIGGWYTTGKTDGWNAAASAADIPGSNTSTNLATFVVPKSSSGTKSCELYVNNYGNDYADIYMSVDGATAITVARYNHGKYTAGKAAGWSAAYGKVEDPDAAAAGTEKTSFSMKIPASTETGGSGGDGQTTKTFYMYKQTPSSSGGFAYVTVGGVTVGRINIGNWWDKGYEAGEAAGEASGWSAAYAEVSKPGSNTSTNSATFTVPKSSSGSESCELYVNNYGNDYADIYMRTDGGTPITVARYQHGKYTAGWNAALASISPDSDISIGSYTNTSRDPGSSYHNASNMRDTIRAAVNNGNWFGFKITIAGVSGQKYYKCDFS